MLCLCDFVTCRKRYYNQSRGVCISALKHCRKMKFRTYLLLTLISKIIYVVNIYVLIMSNFVVLYPKSVCTVEMTM